MIAFVCHAGDYARDPDFRGFLTACRAEPDNDTPRLVLADWLDEWTAGTDHQVERARRHAAFLRAQLAPDYCGRVRSVAGVFGSNSPSPMKVRFDDTTQYEPWRGTPAKAIVNSSGSGIYYKGGLPEAVKCSASDLYGAREMVALWRIPHVYVRYANDAMGVAVARDDDGKLLGLTEEHCWMQADVPFGTNRWVDTTGFPADRCLASHVIETVLGRAFGAECEGATFHAIYKRHWRSTHPC